MVEEIKGENIGNKDNVISNSFFPKEDISYIPQNERKKYAVEEKR